MYWVVVQGSRSLTSRKVIIIRWAGHQRILGKPSREKSAVAGWSQYCCLFKISGYLSVFCLYYCSGERAFCCSRWSVQPHITILERIIGLVRCLTRSVMWLRSVGDGVDSDPTGLQINHNQHPRWCTNKETEICKRKDTKWTGFWSTQPKPSKMHQKEKKYVKDN